MKGTGGNKYKDELYGQTGESCPHKEGKGDSVEKMPRIKGESILLKTRMRAALGSSRSKQLIAKLRITVRRQLVRNPLCTSLLRVLVWLSFLTFYFSVKVPLGKFQSCHRWLGWKGMFTPRSGHLV